MFFNSEFNRKTPLIFQSEAADCGIACIAMILGYYKHDISPAEIKSTIASTYATGLSVSDIINISNQFNLIGRAIQINQDDLVGLSYPIVLHWEFEHFVVYTKSDSKKVTIYDPAIGERKITWKEFNNCFTGIAISFEITDEFITKNKRDGLSYLKLVSNKKNTNRQIYPVLFYTFLFQISLIFTPLLLQFTIDKSLRAEGNNLLIFFVLLLIISSVVQAGFVYLKSIATNRLMIWLEHDIGFSFVSKIFQLCPTFFEGRFIGEIVARSESVKNIRDVLTQEMPQIFLHATFIILSSFMIVFYNITVWITILIFSLLYFSLSYKYAKHKRFKENEYLKNYSTERTSLIESVQQIQTIRLSGSESKKFTQWLNEFSKALEKQVNSLKLENTYELFESIIFSLMRISTIYILVRSSLTGETTIGQFFAAYLFITMFIESLRIFTRSVTNLEVHKIHLQRLEDIILEPNRELVISEIKDRPNLSGLITVNNIGYRYGINQPFLFRNVSFDIHPGETFVITGKSGIGKTTLLKCLLGLYTVNEGSITYDDYNLKNIGMETITKNSSVILQSQNVFSSSILDNIIMYDANYDLELVDEVTKAANIYDTIMEFPMKYDTNAWIALSGGQKQRILIARALYKKPKILFFDEATNQLDKKTEICILNYLKGRNITKIMIAHRQETIDLADQILDIDEYQYTSNENTKSIKNINLNSNKIKRTANNN